MSYNISPLEITRRKSTTNAIKRAINKKVTKAEQKLNPLTHYDRHYKILSNLHENRVIDNISRDIIDDYLYHNTYHAYFTKSYYSRPSNISDLLTRRLTFSANKNKILNMSYLLYRHEDHSTLNRTYEVTKHELASRLNLSSFTMEGLINNLKKNNYSLFLNIATDYLTGKTKIGLLFANYNRIIPVTDIYNIYSPPVSGYSLTCDEDLLDFHLSSFLNDLNDEEYFNKVVEEYNEKIEKNLNVDYSEVLAQAKERLLNFANSIDITASSPKDIRMYNYELSRAFGENEIIMDNFTYKNRLQHEYAGFIIETTEVDFETIMDRYYDSLFLNPQKVKEEPVELPDPINTTELLDPINTTGSLVEVNKITDII